jgi:hypothetical protein
MEKVLERLTSEVRHLHAMDLNLEERMRALENSRVQSGEESLCNTRRLPEGQPAGSDRMCVTP